MHKEGVLIEDDDTALKGREIPFATRESVNLPGPGGCFYRQSEVAKFNEEPVKLR